MLNLLHGGFVHVAPVVQRVDNFVQQISCYPANGMYELKHILSAGKCFMHQVNLSAV